MAADLETATLAAQSYGLAVAQVRFGRPAGVWLECAYCPRSDVIVGSNTAEWVKVPDADVAQVFCRHGWEGDGDAMKNARCPNCAPKYAAIRSLASPAPKGET